MKRSANISVRRAFTLIEILVVIGIMVVLAAMVIPGLRIVTSDRQIREATRVVEAAFSTARDDAVVNGFSGIEIVRNGNYANGGTVLYRLRQLPPYRGDDYTSKVTVSNTPAPNTVSFTAVSYVPQVNDYIKFNLRGPLYRFTGATTIEVLPHQPPPPQGIPLAFQIYRRPVRIESSREVLPARQYIDLRYSGFPAPGIGAGSTGSVVILFDRNGAIDRIYPQGIGGVSLLPASPLYLLMATDEERFDETSGKIPLDNLANLWVSVNQINGGVFVSEMCVSSPAAPLATRVNSARAFAQAHWTAKQ